MSRRRPGHAQTWYDQAATFELPLVAIVGRPNVGKSTLVNRLVGRREAIVEERPGVTRDRKYFEVEWLGRRFRVVDTGGWLDTDEPLDRQVSRQAELAVAEADVVVLVGDVTVGVTEEDAGVADLLRRSGKPVLVVANKADHPNRDVDAWALSRLGLGEPIPISAMHGRSADVLLDALLELLPPEPELVDPEVDDALLGSPLVDGSVAPGAEAAGAEVAGSADGSAATGSVATGSEVAGSADGSVATGSVAGAEVAGSDDPEAAARAAADSRRPFAVAIVGRPNVGKSTLFNRLVGDDRSIVHDMAGTTRDTIDTIVETDDGVLRFVDTAGIRRRSRIDDGVEWFSLVRALQAVDAADATLLVIDATEGVTHQDQRLAERVDGAGCAVVIVLNKWDAVAADDREDIVSEVGEKLSFLAYAPILRVSALTGRGALRIMPALRQARAEYRRRVPTARLNEVLAAAQRRHPPPPGDGGRRPKVKYATQGATDPPTFTLFASQSLPAPYLRYLERSIREAFSFGPTPIKLRVRRKD